MDKQGKIILEGVFVEFDTVNRGRPYYTEEEYSVHLRHLMLQYRRDKLKRIINNIK